MLHDPIFLYCKHRREHKHSVYAVSSPYVHRLAAQWLEANLGPVLELDEEGARIALHRLPEPYGAGLYLDSPNDKAEALMRAGKAEILYLNFMQKLGCIPDMLPAVVSVTKDEPKPRDTLKLRH